MLPLYIQGRIQDFKLGGVHLKKLRRAEGGTKNFEVFRVKNHDFMAKTKTNWVFLVKNHNFTPKTKIKGISCEKSRFYAKKSYFFQF